jgi:hypothetical protein
VRPAAGNLPGSIVDGVSDGGDVIVSSREEPGSNVSPSQRPGHIT